MSVRTAILILLTVPVLLSLFTGIAVVAHGLAYRDFGRELCDYVSGTSGMLPINPNEGGTIAYSCNLKPQITGRYVFYYSVFWSPVMLALSVPAIAAGTFMVRTLRRREKLLPARNDR